MVKSIILNILVTHSMFTKSKSKSLAQPPLWNLAQIKKAKRVESLNVRWSQNVMEKQG